MQIVVTALLDQLYDLLAQGPRIVSLYQQKDAAFIPSLNAWLLASESVLEKGRRPQVGEIAGIRAQLLSASRGVYSKDLASISSSGSPRKKFHASAAILFNNAQRILSSVHATLSGHKEEAERIIRQMTLISLQKNLFFPIWTGNLGVAQKLAGLWQTFSTDNDMVAGTRQVLASVNYVDALRILGETIDDMRL